MNVAESGAVAATPSSPHSSDVDRAWRQFATAVSPEDFCSSWLDIQCQLISGVNHAVLVLQKPGAEAFAPLAYWPEGKRDRSSLSEVVEKALQDGRGVVEPRGRDCRLAYPVKVDGRVRGVVGLDIAARDEAQMQSALRQLQWGAGWLEVMLRRYVDPGDEARLRVRLLLEFFEACLSRDDFKAAALATVTHVATELACDRVSLGFLHGGRVTIEAVSHASQFDRHANLLTATADAMMEAIDQREPVVFPLEREARLVVTHAHAQLAQLAGSGAVASFPLSHEGRAVGALTLERPQGAHFDAATMDLLAALAAMLGPLLELQRVRSRSLPAHAVHSARDLRSRLLGGGHLSLKLTAGVIAALVLFLALADGTHRVTADARIEGLIQRAITAPFSGYVREATGRPGDTVRKGAVLARLEDRDLRVEQARLSAQREQLTQQYREAMAKQERSQARIVSAQLTQVEAQLALVDEQLARTEVSAPFDGVVVSGDLTQLLGSPLERGQVMYEIAPLDAYRIALFVSEQDVADVRTGQTGELVLTPLPSEHFTLKVTKITPVSTAQQGRNVFRAEAELQAEDGSRLRPGMEGVGKIDIGERRLLWIWTRRLWDWMSLKLWAWLP